MAISAGTLANSTPRNCAMFVTLESAIVARLDGTCVLHGDETSWRIRSLGQGRKTRRACLWTALGSDAVHFHVDPARSAAVAMHRDGIITLLRSATPQTRTHRLWTRQRAATAPVTNHTRGSQTLAHANRHPCEMICSCCKRPGSRKPAQPKCLYMNEIWLCDQSRGNLVKMVIAVICRSASSSRCRLPACLRIGSGLYVDRKHFCN